MTIQDQIDTLATQGRRRIAEAERQVQAEEEARQEAERRRIAQQWQPVMTAIKRIVPDWMYPHLQHPDDIEPVIIEHRYSKIYCNPVVLSLPSLAPIYVYTYGDDVYFDVPTPSAEYTEFDEEWYIRWSRYRAERFEVTQMGTDLAVAVALAQSAAAALAVAEAEVQRHNEDETVEIPL